LGENRIKKPRIKRRMIQIQGRRGGRNRSSRMKRRIQMDWEDKAAQISQGSGCQDGGQVNQRRTLA
jgi:hypothetical protein